MFFKKITEVRRVKNVFGGNFRTVGIDHLSGGQRLRCWLTLKHVKSTKGESVIFSSQ